LQHREFTLFGLITLLRAKLGPPREPSAQCLLEVPLELGVPAVQPLA